MDTALGTATHSTQPLRTSDRRRHLRLDAPADLAVTVAGSNTRLVASNISSDGLAVHSRVPFARASIHKLQLTFAPLTVVRQARTVHCRRDPRGGWVLGFALVGSSPAGGPTVEDLIDLIVSSMISFS